MKEIWKEIKNSNGKYCISSFGNIISTNHSITRNDNNSSSKGFYIKPYDTGTSLTVNLYLTSKGETFRLNYLVATHFIDNPNNFKNIIHKDGNYKNCNVDNLEWVEYKPKTFKPKSNIEDNDIEQWRFIPNTNDLYKVSNLGRIFSLKRGRLLKPYQPKDGYYTFIISVNSKTRLGRVHRIVAEAFVPNPNNFSCVDHIDGNKLNNSASNLRWCSQKENINNPNTKTKSKDNRTAYRKPIIQIKDNQTINTYESINQASIMNNFSKSAIYRCCIGLAKTHKGFSWQFL